MKRTAKPSAEWYARLVGGLVAAYIGWSLSRANVNVPPNDEERAYVAFLTLMSIGLGLVLAPYIFVHPLRTLLDRARHMPSLDLAATGVGIFLGLGAAALLTVPLAYLPPLLSQFLPFGAAVVCAYIGAAVTNWRKNDLLALVQRSTDWPAPAQSQRYLVDTSVIVDGRIVALAKTGVLDGTLVVPQFVLREVQQLADSPDDLTRAKGKRGLEVLHTLQHEQILPLMVPDRELPHVRAVDDALVALAKAEGWCLLTNDNNLQQIAALQHIRTINLHQLADALRQPFAHGDTLHITIRQEGRERDQGIGFLHDGTMVVVEDAHRLIGTEVAATITRVYQTGTGRIIFAQRA
jgi:uncharacterized protein YacL